MWCMWDKKNNWKYKKVDWKMYYDASEILFRISSLSKQTLYFLSTHWKKEKKMDLNNLIPFPTCSLAPMKKFRVIQPLQAGIWSSGMILA